MNIQLEWNETTVKNYVERGDLIPNILPEDKLILLINNMLNGAIQEQQKLIDSNEVLRDSRSYNEWKMTDIIIDVEKQSGIKTARNTNILIECIIEDGFIYTVVKKRYMTGYKFARFENE